MVAVEAVFAFFFSPFSIPSAIRSTLFGCPEKEKVNSDERTED